MISLFNKHYLNVVYISLMGLAALISLIKGFSLATILSVGSFGYYVATIAFSRLIAIFISLGGAEQTTKLFPRYWLFDNSKRYVVEKSDALIKVMLIRFSVIIFFASIIMVLIEPTNVLIDSLFFSLFLAISVSVSALNASALRAIGKTNIISTSTLLRTILNIVLSLLGAHLFGWEGAIVGEAFGGFLVAVYTKKIITREVNSSSKKESMSYKDDNTTTASSRKWFFLSSLIVAIPVFLDRTLVVSVYGTNVVGTFGFLMIFVTAANTFTGIVTQKIGPQIIKMERLGSTVLDLISYSVKWIGLLWLVFILGMVSVGIILDTTVANYFTVKFNINTNLLIATTIMCLLQISVIADYIIISKNQERLVFIVNFGYALLFGAVTIALFITELDFILFFWLLVIVRTLYISFQVYCVLKICEPS